MDILSTHRSLLQRNIVPCQELYSVLVQYNVFSETMIEDIKSQGSRESKIDKMIELLNIKGKRSMTSFCDALQLSGHGFIADFLRDEISGPQSGTSIDAKEVMRRIPKIDKVLQDQDKSDLSTYIEEKVQELLMRQTWKRDSKDKEKVMEAKQKQLEENWKFSEMLKEKDEIVKQMQENLEAAVRDAQAKGIELNNVSTIISDLKNKHEQAMTNQLKYNNANDNSLRRLHQRETEMEEGLAGMTNQMSRYMAKESNRSPSVTSNQSEEKVVTVLDRTKHTLQKLLTKMDDLLKMQRMFNDLNDEKHYILGYLGHEGNKSKALREAFQEYILKNDETMEKMNGEIEKLKKQLFELKEKADKAEEELEEVRESNNNTVEDDIMQKDKEIKQLQLNVKQLSSQNNTKSETIGTLEKEIQKLKSHIVKLEKALHEKPKRPSTPRFKDFEESSIPKTPKINSLKDLDGKEAPLQKPKPMFLNSKRDDANVPYIRSKSKASYPQPVVRTSQETQQSVKSFSSNDQTRVSFPPISKKNQVDVRPTQPQSSMPRSLGSRQGSRMNIKDTPRFPKQVPSSKGNLGYGTLLNVSSLQASPSPSQGTSGTSYFALDGFGKP